MIGHFSRRELAGLAALPLILAVGPAAAEEPMDFSDVTSRARAEQLAADGRLVRVLLFPAEFGGEDIVPNQVFVPPALVEIRAMLIGTLTRFIEGDLIDRMRVTPEYRGNSFVPARLRFHCTHSTRSGVFDAVIEIWPVARLDHTDPPA